VLAFTHGTVGIDRRCVLSSRPQYPANIPGIRAFLDAGFVVAATDYAGLGTDETTGYLVGSSQAYSTLDAVRAAVAMPEAAAAPRFVSFGESQGGHASLFTGQFAASYAPELEVAGVAAAAPATDLTELFRANLGTTFGGVLASYALASWRDVYGVDLDDIADPQAIPVIDRIADLCIQTEAQILSVVPEAELLKLRFLDRLPWETEPWATILADNTPGGSLVDAPVFVAQGADDPLVVPEVQQAFVDGWCARGQSIEYRVYDGVGHLDAGRASADDVVAWAVARLDGDPWVPTC
jgi:predicted alpha/beta hydrolase